MESFRPTYISFVQNLPLQQPYLADCENSESGLIPDPLNWNLHFNIPRQSICTYKEACSKNEKLRVKSRR